MDQQILHHLESQGPLFIHLDLGLTPVCIPSFTLLNVFVPLDDVMRRLACTGALSRSDPIAGRQETKPK